MGLCQTPAMGEPVRVAYTVMQCWHRVPGGTASSVLSLASALGDRDDVDLVGVGPWFGGVPAAPWVPPMPVRRLPVPYQLAYEAWYRSSLLAPTWVVPDADVVHATVVHERAAREELVAALDVEVIDPPLSPAFDADNSTSARCREANRSVRALLLSSRTPARTARKPAFGPGVLPIVAAGLPTFWREPRGS